MGQLEIQYVQRKGELMQSDDQPRKKRTTKGRQSDSSEVRMTDEESPEGDAIIDSSLYRSRSSSIRLRDPMGVQTTGPQPGRRNVNADPVTGRVVVPSVPPRT